MRIALATAAALGLASMVMADPAVAAIKKPTNIPAQNLGPALTDFAASRNLQILYFTDAVRNLKTPGAVGEITTDEALTKILSGTGLTYRYVDEKTVTILSVAGEGHGAPVAGGSVPSAAQSSSTAGPRNTEKTRNGSSFGRRFRMAQVDQGQATSSGSDPASRTLLETGTLEEIVVTAQKREQGIQDVPISVSAISGEQLEQQGITQFQDLLRSVPGVSFGGTEPGQSRYNIRGISAAASSPTVGVYLDDVSLVTISTGFSGAFDPAFFDLERVEVLKGPQGTLYGGSAMGGAIKYVSRQPALDETTFSTATGVASTRGGDLSYEAEAVANVPLIEDKFALRGGVQYRQTGGYVDSVADAPTQLWTRSATLPPAPYAPVTYPSQSTLNRDDINEREMLALRLAAKLAPTESLSIVPAALYQRSEKASRDHFFTNLGDFQSSLRTLEPLDETMGIYNVTVKLGLGAAELTSISAFSDREVSWDRDYSLLNGALVPPLFPFDGYNTSDTTTETFTQELRLASAAGEGRLQWVIGVFYSDQRDQLVQTVTAPGASEALEFVGADVLYFGDQRTASTEYAGFGELTYSITPAVDVTLGLRYFDASQTINGKFDGLFNGGPSTVDNKKNTDTGYTPKVTLAWSATDHNLLYTTASKGFRQGGPNRFNTASALCERDFERFGIDRVPAGFGPDSLWTYEIGSKNQLSNRRTTVNGAIYYTDWSKIQQGVVLQSCGFGYTANLGAATVKGAELAVESAVTDALLLGGTVTYTDAQITESAPQLPARVGQPVLETPEWMGNVYGDYRFPVGSAMRATLRAEYQYRGSSQRSFDETVNVAYPNATVTALPNTTQTQQSYDVVNFNLTLTNDRWQYRLYVNNVFDEAPRLDFTRNNFPGTSLATTLRPRTIGAGVRVDF